MAALLALAELAPSDDVGPAVVAMLQKDENAKDRWIPHAATAAAARHDASFLKAVLASASPAEALRNTVRIVTGHYARGAPVESVVTTVLSLDGAPPAVATSLLDGLAANWPGGTAPTFSPGDEAKLNTLDDLAPEQCTQFLAHAR